MDEARLQYELEVGLYHLDTAISLAENPQADSSWLTRLYGELLVARQQLETAIDMVRDRTGLPVWPLASGRE